MNTKQIDYALELAQVKNFNRAAENLFIFQPSLSYQWYDSTRKTE